MKRIKVAMALVLASLGTSVSAQTVADDMHCLLLSNIFAKAATAAQDRQAAGQALMFYLGRVEARADTRAITNAMRAQGARIDQRTASAEMRACTARVTRAQQNIQAAGRAAAGGK